MDVRIGTTVEYRDRDGRTKAAIVTATPGSFGDTGRDYSSGKRAPEEGRVHLTVFSFTGSVYSADNIAPGDGPQTFTLL